MQETATDNTTPLVAATVDEGKNDKSATCLTNHDRKTFWYADKSTQTPVPSDKCLSPLEYETSTEKPYRCLESSAISSQTSTSFDECSSSLGYESMTGKPYQCSESSAEMADYSPTSADLSAISRKMGPDFLVYWCHGAGKKPNVHNVHHETTDITVTSLAVQQPKTKYDKSANCLTNERGDPIGPFIQFTQIPVPSDTSKFEYQVTTTLAQQCTEGSPYNKSGYRLVITSSKTTILQGIDCTLLASSPGCALWPTPKPILEQSSVVLDYKTAQRDEQTLLSPIL